MKPDKLNLRRATKDLSKFTYSMAKETQKHLSILKQEIDKLAEVVNAIAYIVGVESVQDTIDEIREAVRLEQEQSDAAKIAELVKKKVLVGEEVISEDSLIVGTDETKDSKRRVHFEIAAVNPDARHLYLGKKVGDVIESNDAKLNITEVYRVDQDRFKEVVAEEQAAQAQAQAANEQKDPAEVPKVVELAPEPIQDESVKEEPAT
jgi:hypothetical protein